MKGDNIVEKDGEDEEDWGKCFVEETTTVGSITSINFEDGWIIDSDCGRHLIGNNSKFSTFHHYEGNDATITMDNIIHPVEKEGTIMIHSQDAKPITVKSMHPAFGMKKNLFLVANAVNWSHCLVHLKEMKFFWDITNLKGDVIHYSKRVRDLIALSASTSYADD